TQTPRQTQHHHWREDDRNYGNTKNHHPNSAKITLIIIPNVGLRSRPASLSSYKKHKINDR
ncbi:hypothetical protein, partial [Pectobacterium versatile]|uniref:hypothetical protein n=1 Tax=Pectobacterium versatile TaxID=2488639 RepID=UPI0019616145